MDAPSDEAEAIAAPCELLEWDSRNFGFPIARVIGPALDLDRAAAVDQWCSENRIRCLYLLADADDPITARLGATRGYRQVDARVTVRGKMGEVRLPPPNPAGVAIREADERDLGFAVRLAGQTRFASRFYLDRGFPADRCAAMYEEWVRRGMRDPARAVMVAEVDGRPAGFHVLGPVERGGEGYAELLAVDPAHRGVGVATELMAGSIRYLADRGAAVYRSVRSFRNVTTSRMHVRLGLLTDEVQIWHHKWFPAEHDA